MPTASSASTRPPNRVPHLTLARVRVPHLRAGFIVAKVGVATILFALLILPLAAQPSLTLPTGQTLTATVTARSTILHVGHHRITLQRDNTVAPSSQPTLKLVAELLEKALLLTDTYPSRPAGLSRCQAGEEQFLRLITLSARPTVTFSLKIGSCRDTTELAGDGLQWVPTTQTLTIRWLTPPAGQPNPLNLHIPPDDRPGLNP